MGTLKDYRCKICKKLFFKGDLKTATVEVKCKNCKNINLIECANDCELVRSRPDTAERRPVFRQA